MKLNRLACKRCAVEFAVSQDEELAAIVAEVGFDDSWREGYVKCPEYGPRIMGDEFMATEVDEPPSGCPFVTEHLVSQ